MKFALRSGVFLISFSLLFLEIVATRVFASILGDEWLLYTVPMAMLGMGAAGSVSILTATVKDMEILRRRVVFICCCAAAATLLLFVSTAVSSSFSNARLDSLSDDLTSFEFFRTAFRLSLFMASVVASFMALSYFFHGFVLTQLFRNVDRSELHTLYGADLIGAFAGAVIAVLSLEYGGFWVPLGIAVNAPLLAAAAFAGMSDRKRAVVLVGVSVAVMGALSVPAVSSSLESTPHLRSIARLSQIPGYRGVRELGHWWTSYGLISAVEVVRPTGATQTTMVHGAGEGHARVIPYGDPTPPEPIRVLYGAEVSVSACQPDRVLVALVGPATEMVLIDRITEGRARITGVELVSKVVEWPLEQERFRLKELISNPNHRLVIAEAREFLARDTTQYDCILASWSGASRSYYTGTMAGSPDYIYTREGIEELLDHLAPDGQLSLFNVNQVRIMLTVHEILKSRGQAASFPRSLVVLGNAGATDEQWDVQSAAKILIKPSGFTPQDVANISGVVKGGGWDVIYEPNMSPEHSDFWYDAIHAEDPSSFVEPIAREHGVHLEPSTDDKPFVHDVLAPHAVFSSWFWFGDTIGGSRTVAEGVVRSWEAKRRNLIVVLMFSVASAVLILAPLRVKRLAHQWSAHLVRNTAYFASLGAGFMFVEMATIQKFRLMVGHPGYTLATVLASIVLFAGLGSLASRYLFRRGTLTLRSAALLTILTTIVGTIVLFDVLSPTLLALPRGQKMMLAFLLPALPAFFMGQLYPQGLAILPGFEGEIPLYMAVNAVTGTIAAGLGVTLAQVTGYNALIVVGCAFYLAAGLLATARVPVREVDAAARP
jgi:hypothetical protein